MQATSVRSATVDDLEPLANLFDQYRQFYEQPADLAQAHAYTWTPPDN